MTGDDLYRLAAELFPIHRSITGPGFSETLRILERFTGAITRHTWASGSAAFDWTAPDEWVFREAWIRDPHGRKIVDTSECNLHVVAYSEPVHRLIDLRELQEHLHSLPGQPTAIPYRTSYYERGWGFCLAQEQRDALVPGTYEVMIDADLGPGQIEVGEVVLPGTTDREILISTYCCHPSLANNEVSGPVVAAFLARELRARASRRYTYRLLFVPETIGSILYLHRFGDELRRHVDAGWVVTCVGDEAPFTYKRSRRGTSLSDRVAEHVLRSSGREHTVVDFFPFGSDERQYCSPGFDLPVGSLMRSMYETYPEYHTSLDDLSLISAQGLADSYGMYVEMIDLLEANGVLTATMPYCEPQLGKRGVFPQGGGTATDQAVKDILWLLNLCDGTRDLLAVAERAGRPGSVLAAHADKLVAAGLLCRSGDALL